MWYFKHTQYVSAQCKASFCQDQAIIGRHGISNQICQKNLDGDFEPDKANYCEYLGSKQCILVISAAMSIFDAPFFCKCRTICQFGARLRILEWMAKSDGLVTANKAFMRYWDNTRKAAGRSMKWSPLCLNYVLFWEFWPRTASINLQFAKNQSTARNFIY